MKMRFVILLKILLLVSYVSGKSGKNAKPACYELPGKCDLNLDIQIIIDESGSVGRDNFDILKTVLADDLLGMFHIAHDKARFALTVYSSANNVRNEFGLTKYHNAEQVRDHILGLKYRGGRTATGDALESAYKSFMADHAKYNNAVLLLITDGKSSEGGPIHPQAVKWNKVATVFAVGITSSGVNKRMLCSKKVGVNLSGNNIKGSPLAAANYEECVVKCESTPGCVAFTFVGRKNRCWVKSRTGSSTARNGVISATCKTGLTEVTLGNTKRVYTVDDYEELPHVLDSYVKETCDVRRPGIVPKYDCLKCQAESWALYLSGMKVWINECDPDGSFSAKQCDFNPDVNKCWCVNKFGDAITEMKPSTIKLDCDKEREKLPKEIPHCLKTATSPKRKYTPKCDSRGYYKPKQCKLGFCWCMLEDGRAVPNTIYHSTVKNPPKCRKHQDLRYNCGKRVGAFEHPFDYKRYIWCTSSKALACTCPGNLVFNPWTGSCDWTAQKPSKN